MRRSKTISAAFLRGCLHDTGATFAPARVHSGSFSRLYIVYMIPPQNFMSARVTAAWVNPGCCTGARISLRYEIVIRNRKVILIWNSRRCEFSHVNAPLYSEPNERLYWRVNPERFNENFKCRKGFLKSILQLNFLFNSSIVRTGMFCCLIVLYWFLFVRLFVIFWHIYLLR